MYSDYLFMAADITTPPPQYQIGKSVRFTVAGNKYFQRTFPTSPADTSTTTKTYSMWFKRGLPSTASRTLFGSASTVNGVNVNFSKICLETTSTTPYTSTQDCVVLYMFNNNTGGASLGKSTIALLRDPAAWYHLVVVVDTTQSVAEDRYRIYINGVRNTTWNNNAIPAQNRGDSYNLAGSIVNVGTLNPTTTGGNQPFDGYIAEFYAIDGQALTPSSFGKNDTTTGQWIPIQYTGTYGTNGFYLDFSDPSSTTNLGLDRSGNGKNFTPNNFSVTAGSTNDSMFDSPTSFLSGGNYRGNYSTFNTLHGNVTAVTLTNANLTATLGGTAGSNAHGIPGTVRAFSGKWYVEWTINTIPGGAGALYPFMGFTDINSLQANNIDGSLGYSISVNGRKNGGGLSQQPYAAAFTTGDVCMGALDLDNGMVWFGKNGTWLVSGDPVNLLNPTFTVTPTVLPFGFAAGISGDGGAAATINFGQQGFTYTPPAGFSPMVVELAVPTPAIKTPASYNASLNYTGSASVQALVTGFQPDWLWIKSSTALYSQAFDSGRGNTLSLPGNVAVETTISGVTLNANGFNVPANTANVSNTGVAFHSLSMVKGPTYGFDVVTFTGDGTSNRAITHNCGGIPEAIILHRRDVAGNWYIWHKDMASSSTYNTMEGPTTETTSSPPFGTGTKTSTTFYVTGNGNILNGTYVAYVFCSVPEYCRVGTYTSIAQADGAFVSTDFMPSFVIHKASSASVHTFFTQSQGTNPCQGSYMNLNNTDAAGGNTYDHVSNGFKQRASFVAATIRYIALANVPQLYGRGV